MVVLTLFNKFHAEKKCCILKWKCHKVDAFNDGHLRFLWIVKRLHFARRIVYIHWKFAIYVQINLSRCETTSVKAFNALPFSVSFLLCVNFMQQLQTYETLIEPLKVYFQPVFWQWPKFCFYSFFYDSKHTI